MNNYAIPVLHAERFWKGPLDTRSVASDRADIPSQCAQGLTSTSILALFNDPCYRMDWPQLLFPPLFPLQALSALPPLVPSSPAPLSPFFLTPGKLRFRYPSDLSTL